MEEEAGPLPLLLLRVVDDKEEEVEEEEDCTMVLPGGPLFPPAPITGFNEDFGSGGLWNNGADVATEGWASGPGAGDDCKKLKLS
jgi:hypothetical protein